MRHAMLLHNLSIIFLVNFSSHYWKDYFVAFPLSSKSLQALFLCDSHGIFVCARWENRSHQRGTFLFSYHQISKPICTFLPVKMEMSLLLSKKKKKIFIWIRNCNSLRVIFQVSTIPFTCSGALSINLSLSRSLTLSLSLSLPPVVINRSLIQFPELINGSKWSKTKYITTTKLSISHDPISPHGKSYQTVWFPCRTQFLKLFFHTCISTSSF